MAPSRERVVVVAATSALVAIVEATKLFMEPRSGPGVPTQYQLREYEVKPGEMDEFVKEWHDIIYPMRQKFGFTVVGAWRIGDERFIWILRWEHAHKTFEEAEKAYYDSDERKAIQPPPTRHLSHVETSMMTDAVPTPKGLF